MTTHWKLTLPPGLNANETACLQKHFGSIDAAFTLESDSEPVAISPYSIVLKIELAGKTYYVKRYHSEGKRKHRWKLRRWLGRPRVQNEWENLRRFARWGIPTATIIARGLERRYGTFIRGALITAALPDTQDLALLFHTADPRLRDRDWVRTLSHQLAHITRTLHTHRFTHNDLKWRNLLIDNATPPKLYLIDCPGGTFWIPPFLEYRIIKDLACLDKVARQCLSRTRRLRFYLDYTTRAHLSAKDKTRLRRILTFFDGRE